MHCVTFSEGCLVQPGNHWNTLFLAPWILLQGKPSIWQHKASEYSSPRCLCNNMLRGQTTPTGPTVTCPRSETAAPAYATQTDPSRHADLWFPDGSVVLHAENTLFRVHMSQLSRHSVVFRDMFSLPRSSASAHDLSADDIYEGCPLVRLHDLAEDVANLLSALYDGPCVDSCLFLAVQSAHHPSRTFGSNDCSDFRIVSGILRLSNKYMIESLRAKAIAHLNIAWPMTLKGWDAREDKARAYELENIPGSAHLYPSPIVRLHLSSLDSSLSLS